MHASPTVDTATGDLYVGSTDGKMYAFNLTTGAVAWSFQTGGAIVGSAAVANGLVYFPSYDGRLFVLRADTGVPVWWHQTGAISESSPAVVNGIVYLGNNAGGVFAFNAFTGAAGLDRRPRVARCTRRRPWPTAWSTSAPMDGSVYAFDAATGARLWSYATGYPFTSSPSRGRRRGVHRRLGLQAARLRRAGDHAARPAARAPRGVIPDGRAPLS